MQTMEEVTTFAIENVTPLIFTFDTSVMPGSDIVPIRIAAISTEHEMVETTTEISGWVFEASDLRPNHMYNVIDLPFRVIRVLAVEHEAFREYVAYETRP